MSDGLNKKFMQEKQAFLDTHFLIFSKNQELDNKGLYDFDLSLSNENIVNSGGRQMKAVNLRPFSARGNTGGKYTKRIRAYYLPYGDNAAWHHRLIDDVDYCFTDTLNGCTFVVDGNPTTPFISHYNYVTGGLTDQAKIDLHITQRYNGPTRQVGGVIRKADYKTGAALDYKVTIVGIRGGNGHWHFYYQRRQTDLIMTPNGSKLQTIALDTRVTLV